MRVHRGGGRLLRDRRGVAVAGRDRGAERERRRQRDRGAEPERRRPLPTPRGHAPRPARPLPTLPAVGRQGAPQRPPRRLRPAPGRVVVQHRHADRRVRRARDRRGRDVPGAARHGRRARCRPTRAASGAACTGARSTAGSRRTATAPTCGPARPRTRAASTRSRRCSASSTASTSATTRSSTSRASARSSTRWAASTSTSRSRSPRASTPWRRGVLTRIYIPAGPQHMTGAEALRYARSRHRAEGGDFDRGRRQQRVLLSLREQMNAQAIIANLPELVDALKDSVKTDIKTKDLPKLLALAEGVDTKNIRSFVFAPSYYAPGVPEPRRAATSSRPTSRASGKAVDQAFKVTPELLARRERLESEGATRLGPQRVGTRRARDVVGRVPRVPGAQRLGAAAVARRAPREDEDRRLQRQGDGPARDDQVPRAPVRHDGHDRHRPGARRGHRRSRSARTPRTWTSTPSADGGRAARRLARRPAIGRSRGQPSTGVSQLRYSSRFPRTAAK